MPREVFPLTVRSERSLDSIFGFKFWEELCLRPDQITVEMAKIATNLIGKHEEYKEILDLGTGSGIFSTCILLNSHKPSLHITATDIDPLALDIACDNLTRATEFVGLQTQPFSLVRTSWVDSLTQHRSGGYHLFFANPPFFEHGAPVLSEFQSCPTHSMYANEQGLEHYDSIFRDLANILFANSVGIIRLPRDDSRTRLILNTLNRHLPRINRKIVDIPAGKRKGRGLFLSFDENIISEI